MLNLEDEAVSVGDKPAALPEAKPLEIKVQPTDAIGAPKVQPADAIGAPKLQPSETVGAPAPIKNLEKVSIEKKPSLFGRFLRFTARAIAVVCLCGVAWGAGAFYSGHLPLHFLRSTHAAAVDQSPGHDELVTTVRQMGEEIRALKASVDSKSAEPGVSATSAQGQQTAGPTTADLVGRVDKLESDLTSKLSQMNEQLTSIQQQIAASHVAAARTTVTTHAPVRAKRVERYHDAFDPAHDPAAPGAPRPLGSH